MTRKWLQSVDVQVDETGQPVFEQSLATLAETMASPGCLSSGTTPKATTDDTPVELIAADATKVYHHLRIWTKENYGVHFFVSWDGGTAWHGCSGDMPSEFHFIRIDNHPVQFKRAPGGSNVSNVFAGIW